MISIICSSLPMHIPLTTTSLSSSSMFSRRNGTCSPSSSQQKRPAISRNVIVCMIICFLATTTSFVATIEAFVIHEQKKYYPSNYRYFPPQLCIREQVTATKTIISLSFSIDNRRATRTSSSSAAAAALSKARDVTKRTSSTRLGIAKSGGKMIENEKEFADNVLSKDLKRPVLVFFTAPWCGPCRLTVPVVKDVMKQYAGELDVVEICTDDLAEVAEESGVVSIPTIQFYYDGTALETHSIVGCVAKSVLSNAIDKVIEDVTQIQKQQQRQQ